MELARKNLGLHGGEISYLEGGPAKGLLLHFAHATGFNAATYGPLLAPLSTNMHVLASDARGHGFTTLPIPPGTAKGWAIYREDLSTFLAHCGTAPVILAGHSMGAIASLMVAAHEPQRIAGLVLIEPVLIPKALLWYRLFRQRSPGPDLATRAARRRRRFDSADAAFQSYRGRGAFRTWPDPFLRAYLDGGLVTEEDGSGVALACTPEWEAETFRSSPLGAARLANRIRCPVTLLYAEESTPPESECKAFARRHGNTRLIKVPDTTHFLPMEKPELVRSEIARMASAVMGKAAVKTG